MKIKALHILLLFAIGDVYGGIYPSHANHSSLVFEENKGQIKGQDAKSVMFALHQNGFNMFLLEKGIAYQFTKITLPQDLKAIDKSSSVQDVLAWQKKKSEAKVETYRMDLEFEGASNHVEIIQEGQSPSVTNYYGLNALNIRSYSKITYKNIYPNIDWVIYGKGETVKYDFVVRPGGNPKNIRLKTKWVEDLKKEKDGSLVLMNRLGQVKESSPISFQANQKLKTEFNLTKDWIGFDVQDFDPSMTLVIDPDLNWGTYYGNDADQSFWSTAVDASGNVYAAGSSTMGTTNTLAVGGHQTSFGLGSEVALLVKFDKTGSRLWSTYYGSESATNGMACTVDKFNNVYLAGRTNSSASIASSLTVHQPSLNVIIPGVESDGFIAKFDQAGAIIWATYYGGTAFDEITSIAVDASANVFVGGTSLSDNTVSEFIATTGAAQTTNSGSGDAFLVKFNSAGVRQWGTFIGGVDAEEAKVALVDNSGNAYLAGYTFSGSDIATSGSHQPAQISMGVMDGFITKINGTDGTKMWGTYYGGALDDQFIGGSIDASNNIYLSGATKSDTGISSSGHQMNYGGVLGSDNDAFLVKLTKDGTRLWGTYCGAAGEDKGYACALDNKGNVFLSGSTTSTDSISLYAYQSNLASASKEDAFLVKYTVAGVRKWGTYYGGGERDYAFGFAADKNYNLYLVGSTASTNLPTFAALQGTNQGMTDAFITQLTDSTTPSITISADKPNPICKSTKVTFSPTTTKGGTAPLYEWYKNGILVGTDTIYKDSLLNDMDNIQCRLKSNDSSITIDTAWSNVISVNILSPQQVTIDTQICADKTFFFKGAFHSPPIIVIDTLKDLVNGCDSIVKLDLKVRPNDLVEYTPKQSICKYSSFFFIDTSVGDSGRHYRYYKNVYGCDSAVYVDIEIIPQLTLPTVNDTVCSNALPRTYNTRTYSAAGTYQDSIADLTTGCWNLFTYKLVVKTAPANTVIPLAICANKPYFFNGAFRDTAGTYRDTFVSANGCDSIVILNLTVKPIDSNVSNKTICFGDSYFFAGKFRTTTGKFYDTLVGRNGCDSLSILNLTVRNKITKNLTPIICSNDNPYFFKGIKRDTTGVFYDTLKSVLTGCDSFVTLSIIVNKISFGKQDTSICEGYGDTIKYNSKIYKPGVYYDTLVNSKLCDSIVTFTFKILPKTRDTIRKYFCTGTKYLFGRNKQLVTKTGYYYDTLLVKNKNGCDSISVLDIKIGLNDKVTLDNGIDFKSWQDSVSYQWYYCNPWRLIKDATKQKFTTTTKGSYAVVISDGRCTDTTDCIKLYTYDNTSGVNSVVHGGIQIYPNPTSDKLTIENSKIESKVYISLYDLLGKKVIEKQYRNINKLELELKTLSNGLYMLHYDSETRNEIFKIQKD